MTEIHDAEIETAETLHDFLKQLTIMEVALRDLHKGLGQAFLSVAKLKAELEGFQPIEAGVCEHCGTAVCPHVLGYVQAMTAGSDEPTAS